MSAPRLILASTSTFRRALLERLGLPFTCEAPRFEEALPPAPPSTPDQVRALVLENARGKAESLRALHPGAFILASDQLAECEGRVLMKPGTPERAEEQLRFLRGREHRLHTAVVLADTGTGTLEGEVVTNVLRVRALSDAQIRRYVERDNPVDAAGSYLSEGLGIALFDWIRGDDPTAVIGLPLIATCRLLEEVGIDPLAGAAPGSEAPG